MNKAKRYSPPSVVSASILPATRSGRRCGSNGPELNLDPVDLPEAVAEAYPEIQEFWPELHLELQPDLLRYRLV